MSGRPIAVLTRPDGENERLADRLAARGIDSRIVPCVRIEPLADPEPLRVALRALTVDDLLVVTSRAGARAIGAALRGDRCAAPVAAVGERTADACREAGLRVVFTPSAPSGAALAEELPVPRGVVLLARSDRAAGEPVGILRRRGAVVREVVAYRTVSLTPDADPTGDVVVFASPSAVEGFVGRGASGARAVAIGPATAERVRALLRIEPRIAAPSDDAIAAAVQSALEGRHDLVRR